METSIIDTDFKNIMTYKDKRIINIFKKITYEEIKMLIDSSVLEFISTLDSNTVNSLFRNSNALMQNKLWENDNIQRMIILGNRNINNFNCDDQVIRNLENLNKVIKSQPIKRQLYNNKYFITIIMLSIKIENRFFHSYDIKKVFDGMVNSEEFNSLSKDKQLRLIEKLNSYTKDLMLPNDFRKKYKNVERVLLESDVSRIDENILEQLNDDELFLIDYLKSDKSNNKAIKKYIVENIKENELSFEQLFEELEIKENLISEKIRNGFNKNCYNLIGLKEIAFHILLHELDDEIIKEKLLKYLLVKIMKDTSVNAELMYNTLKRNINNGLLNYIDVKRLSIREETQYKDLKLIFYLKFNISLSSVRYLNGITSEQLSKINVKHINKLSKFLEDKTQDELSSIYGVCIKLYFIFGYERSLEILSGKYGEYNRIFLDNVAKTDVSRVNMIEEGNKYIPCIDKRFINFMFENPKNNHFIDMLNDKNSELYRRWYYFYNYYDEILEKCHNEITLKKIISILETEKYDISRSIITPDCNLLNNNSFLENIVLGNRTGYTNDEVLKSIVDIYKKMKKRIESSIPYVEDSSTSGYKYQTMKLDDYRAFELGYKANCCIRTMDIAHNHLLHATLCRNGRIILIYDKLGYLAAFCPIKRNGNVLIVNSIECVDKRLNETGNFINTAFSECVQDIVDVSKKSNEPIELVCIGTSSYLKPNCIPFPKEYMTPTIYEKDDEVYNDTDIYHKSLDIVYKDKNFKFENIKSKDPEVSYMDPRDEVKFFDYYKNRNNIDEVLDIINSINYSYDPENYRPIIRYGISTVYYNKDWFIIKSNFNDIISKCLDYDYRAKEEYINFMNIIKEEDYQKVLKL